VLQRAEYLGGGQAQALARLRQQVRAGGLRGLPCVLLPQAADYQLLLTSRPQVDDSELAAALRWQIRDQVSQAPEALVVDAWPLPPDTWRNRTPMAYCAVMPRVRMQELATLVADSGLRLHAIDIQEMVLRNLGLLAAAGQRVLAVIWLQARETLVCIQQGSELLMTRRIDTGESNRGADAAGLALEVQRSFDYFERQLTRGAVSELRVLPALMPGRALSAELQANLALPVHELAGGLLHAPALASLPAAERTACVLALGAALRQEDA
jgi:MSHA biogenesis protein MshI